MKRILLLLLLSTFFFKNIHAQVFVDGASGVDAWGYGTPSMPYKTISYAVTSAQYYNQTDVFVQPGTYAETTEIYINKPLNLQRWSVGAVIIDGSQRSPATTSKYLIAVVNTGHVLIDGITLQNYVGDGYKGIYILSDQANTGTNDSITISHCRINNISWIDNNLVDTPANSSVVANAIVVEGRKPITNVRLIANEVSNCATGWGEAITFKGDVSNFVVDSNKVHHIANIGIVFYGGDGTAVASSLDQPRNGLVSNNEIYNCMSGIANASGLYLDGSRNITVYHNKLHNNAVGLSMGAELTTTNTVGQHKVNNNLIYNNSVAGVYFGSNNSLNTVVGVSILNNTLTGNSTGLPINGVSYIRTQTVSAVASTLGELCLFNLSGNNLIQNNIFNSFPAKRCMVTMSTCTITGLASDYNLFSPDAGGTLFYSGSGSVNNHPILGAINSLSDWQSATGLEQHSRVGNAAFTDLSGWDLSLQSQSAAINIGGPYDPLYSGLVDYAGFSRVYGLGLDAGAYEFQGQPTNVSNTVRRDLCSVSPNPAHNYCNIIVANACSGFTVILTDVMGRKILECYSGSVTGNQVIPISLANFSSGIYLLHVSANNNTDIMKIIVQ